MQTSPKIVGNVAPIDWSQEADEFVNKLADAVNKFTDGSTPVLKDVLDTTEALYGHLRLTEEDAPQVVFGFGAGVLMGLLAGNANLRETPPLAKDLAVHYTAAFLAITASGEATPVAKADGEAAAEETLAE